MFADRIRGGAGIAFAILALVLWRGGAGISETAAAPGCKDDPLCYAETTEEGVVGPQGMFITSHTATCKGDCLPGQTCEPITNQNADGTTTFQCSCDPNQSPAACSGFPTVDADGQVQRMSCLGDCGTAKCKKIHYNVETDQNCPMGFKLNRRCVCE